MSEMTVLQAIELALHHHQAGRLQEAEALYRQVLAVDPQQFDALQLLGLIATQSGHHAAAVELMSRAVAINNSVAGVHANLAGALREVGQPERAIAHAEAACALDPALAAAHTQRAAALYEAGRAREAVDAWRHLIHLEPAVAAHHANLAATLEFIGQLEPAVSAAWRAVELDPNSAVAHMNLGSALAKLGRYAEALAEHRRAVELQPNYALAQVNLAFAHQELGELERAEAAARRAIALDESEVGGHRNLGAALHEQGRLREAEAAYAAAANLLERRAAATSSPSRAAADRALADQIKLVAATLVPTLYDSVAEIDEARQRLTESLARLRQQGFRLDLTNEPAPVLFAPVYHGRDDRPINEAYASLMSPPPLAPPIGSGRAGGRIRVGFASRFLRDHTIGRLNRGLIDQLDRDRFEVVVLTVGDAGDDIARFLRGRADRFIVLPQSLPAARQLVAQQQLDVLLYTDLGMDPVTYSLAHSRLAPVQCTTWGHPVTSGITAIDYFISSELLEPPDSQSQYTERLVTLPHLAVYYHRPAIAAPKTRADFGLPEGATLYGCLQMLWKFHPEFDPLLGEILRRDPASILLITSGLSAFWDQKLTARFRRTMPDVAGRIRFVPRQNYDAFLALTSLCDVMLDPIHFGGGNTTYEALAFGVPVVTLPSEFIRGRISKALYDTMGVPDCVAATAEQYVELASSLGRDADRRAAVREKILAAAPAIFENPAGVRELEQFLSSVARA